MPALTDLPCLSLEHTLRDAVAMIDRTREGIALITDGSGRLIGTVTDGDIRRGLLSGVRLEEPLATLQQVRPDAPQRPVSARLGTGAAELIELMRQHQIRQIPLVDQQSRPIELRTLSDLQPELEAPFQALVMAGGLGRRLRPLTDEMPKPMLPVGGRPLMEHVIEQLRAAGIQRVNISTHYKPERIVEHFRDGQHFGVHVHYVTEERPLGTAGALALLERSREPVLVLNGDILTNIDYKAFFNYHCETGAVLTVGVRSYEVEVPYGVVESEGVHVRGLAEKPTLRFFVNAGMYVVGPAALERVPREQRFDMTDLIARLIAEGLPVVAFPIHEYWLDIGRHDDYHRAQNDLESGRLGRAA
jgi:dTDP-glucose pyrophosphorylase/CBS domain-containing protein